LHQFLRLVKGTEKLRTCQIRANKNMIWLLLPVSDWPIVVVGTGGWLAMSSLPPICSLSFNFMGKVVESK
jgi:hypothetical protein